MENKLDVQTVKAWVKSLTSSQGSYGRLYKSLIEDKQWEQFVKYLNDNNVKDSLDMVLLIEG